VRIYKTYGADAIPMVSANPYCLARDIVGIGFKSADLIAERLGIAKTAMIRARAGLEYALMEAVAEGHCGLPEDELLAQAPHTGQHRGQELLQPPRAGFQLSRIHASQVYAAQFRKLRYT
jgi:hypothetical protein